MYIHIYIYICKYGSSIIHSVFEGFVLEPCFLQPCFHVAGPPSPGRNDFISRSDTVRPKNEI